MHMINRRRLRTFACTCLMLLFGSAEAAPHGVLPENNLNGHDACTADDPHVFSGQFGSRDFRGCWPDHNYTPSPADWRDLPLYQVAIG